MSVILPPVLLSGEHDLNAFDCGVESLNGWLKQRALKNQQSGASKTYVICEGNRVIGYYCLATGAIILNQAPPSIRRNMPDPIPVLVLGRFAIDQRYQNRKLGSALLRDAVLRASHVSESVGVTAILVHAISERAKAFYKSSGFLESPIQPMTLCLPMATVHELVRNN